MRKMTDKNEERIQNLEDDTAQHRSELNSYDVDFRAMHKRINELEEQNRLLDEKVSEQEDLINEQGDEIDRLLSKVGMIDVLIAYWNAHHPDDPITVKFIASQDKRYAGDDEEWKRKTRVPHPATPEWEVWKKKKGMMPEFDPSTGEWN